MYSGILPRIHILGRTTRQLSGTRTHWVPGRRGVDPSVASLERREDVQSLVILQGRLCNPLQLSREVVQSLQATDSREAEESPLMAGGGEGRGRYRREPQLILQAARAHLLVFAQVPAVGDTRRRSVPSTLSQYQHTASPRCVKRRVHFDPSTERAKTLMQPLHFFQREWWA